MNFSQAKPGPEPETPEETSLREEKENFLEAEADRLAEMCVPELLRKKALADIGERYQQWRDEHTAAIAALPGPESYDKETFIRLGDMAERLHRDVDAIVIEASRFAVDPDPVALLLRRELQVRHQEIQDRDTDKDKDIDL